MLIVRHSPSMNDIAELAQAAVHRGQFSAVLSSLA
jgi:hypothetical protein